MLLVLFCFVFQGLRFKALCGNISEVWGGKQCNRVFNLSPLFMRLYLLPPFHWIKITQDGPTLPHCNGTLIFRGRSIDRYIFMHVCL